MVKKLKSIIQDNLDELSDSMDYPLLDTTYVEGITAVQYPNPRLTIPYDYPKFKNINHRMIAQLRLMLHQNPSDEQVAIWCNKILRYIEIRYAILKTNEQKYGRSSQASALLFHQIFALFIEYHIHTLDLLYLNTALKINDLDYLKSNHKTMAVDALYRLKTEQLNSILYQLEHE